MELTTLEMCTIIFRQTIHFYVKTMYNITKETEITRSFAERVSIPMKKIVELSPIIVAVVIIAVLAGLFAMGAFDVPEETIITSSTLTEVIQTAKLTTAKYVQHGIAKAHIDGKQDGYVLYYAIVKPNVNLAEITYEIDHDTKEVTVVIPEKFTFDVELLEDDNHKFYYYPKNQDDWTGRDVSYICETDAKQKAEANTELIAKARESLINTIEALLNPILSRNDYTFTVEISAN